MLATTYVMMPTALFVLFLLFFGTLSVVFLFGMISDNEYPPMCMAWIGITVLVIIMQIRGCCEKRRDERIRDTIKIEYPQ